MINDVQYQDLTSPEFVEFDVGGKSKDRLKLDTPKVITKPDKVSQEIEKTSQEINPAELRSITNTILNQLKRLTNYTTALVFGVNGGKLTPIEDTAYLPDEFLGELINLDFLVVPFQRQSIKIGDDMHDHSGWLELLKSYRKLPSYLYSIHSYLILPLLSKNQTVGLIVLGQPVTGYFSERHERFAGTIMRQALTAYERLNERAQKSAVTDERARLARELHDTVTQVLYGVALAANSAEMMVAKNPTEAVNQLKEIQNLAQSGLIELRAFILELHPDTLEKDGLLEALRRRLTVLDVCYHLEIEDKLGRSEPKIARAYKEVFYKVALEALSNIVKHAKATKVRLRFSRQPEWLELEVTDDGVGFEPNKNFPGHLGLVSMRERVESVGGEFHLLSRDKQNTGTTIIIRLPLK